MSLNHYDELESMIGDVMNAHMGESFTFIPMSARANQRARVDATRPEQTLCGCWSAPHKRTDLDKNETIDKKSRMSFLVHSASQIFVQFKICDFEYEPRQFDRLRRDGNGLLYEITDIRPNGHSTMDVHLNEIEGPYELTA